MKSCLTKIAVLMFIFILPCDAGFADDTDTNYACDVTPTIRSAANGNWNDPNVWDTGKVPDKGDWVLVNPEHTITLPNAVDLDNGGICNRGIMQSNVNVLDSPATRIEIQAAAVHNIGEIIGQNGKDGVCGWTSYCERYNICDLATYNNKSSLLPKTLPKPPSIPWCGSPRISWGCTSFICPCLLDSWFKIKKIPINQHPTSVSSIRINSNRFVSLESDAEQFGRALRGHRGIENSVHRVSDVAFREDQCRIHNGHAAENFAIIRHIALNLLRHEQSLKKGIAVKRHKAGWNNNYFMKVLKAV